MCRDGFANPVDAGAGDWDFEEELGGEDVVFNIGVGNVDGIGCEEGDRVDLEEGSDFGDFEVGVESVAEESVAGIGV